MKILQKTQFIYLVIFILILSFSKQLVNIQYDQPIKNNLHKNFNKYVSNLKIDFDYVNEIRNQSNDICLEIKSGNFHRHSTRWVFEKFRIFLFEKTNKITNNISKNTYLFSLIISLIFFTSFYLVNKLLIKNQNKNEINFTIISFLVFIFFLTIFLIRPLGEIRFSIFELFFISTSLYFAFNKYFLLYLLSVIFCALNRESGLVCSTFWFIINTNFLDKKLTLKSFFLNINLRSISPIFLSILIFIVFNFDVIKCLNNLDFIIPKDSLDGSLIKLNYNFFSISTINSVFINYVFILILLILFYNKSKVQKKMLLIILLYYFIFIIFTSLIQNEIRILLIPFLMLYIFDFYSKNKLTY